MTAANNDEKTLIDDGGNSPRSVCKMHENNEAADGVKICKRISWHNDVTTATVDIPRVDPDLKRSLFYNKKDISQFRAVEQKRIDKMMMKRIQRMVRETMADEIADAEARGATKEEIEAMLPHTPEEIFRVLQMPVDLDASSSSPGMNINDEDESKAQESADDDSESSQSETETDDEQDDLNVDESQSTKDLETLDDSGTSFVSLTETSNNVDDETEGDVPARSPNPVSQSEDDKDSDISQARKISSPRSPKVAVSDDDIYAIFGLEEDRPLEESPVESTDHGGAKASMHSTGKSLSPRRSPKRGRSKAPPTAALALAAAKDLPGWTTVLPQDHTKVVKSFPMVNGSHPKRSSLNAHTTRKSTSAVSTQRTDYDVRGGWSSPL